MQPNIRRQRLIDFSSRIRGSEEHAKIRQEFGLEMERDLVRLNAHIIDGEKLYFRAPDGEEKELKWVIFENDFFFYLESFFLTHLLLLFFL